MILITWFMICAVCSTPITITEDTKWTVQLYNQNGKMLIECPYCHTALWIAEQRKVVIEDIYDAEETEKEFPDALGYCTKKMVYLKKDNFLKYENPPQVPFDEFIFTETEQKAMDAENSKILEWIEGTK